MNPEWSVRAAADAFETLMAALRRIDPSDEIVGRPSGLTGWSIGHVLTHLARNANSYERVVRATKKGRVADQYPGGATQRQEEIEHGSKRPLAEQLEDLIASEATLAAAFGELTAADWRSLTRRWGNQAWPVADIPFLRCRELSIHSIDLRFGNLGVDDWGDYYVKTDLHRQLAAVAGRFSSRVVIDVCPHDADWSLLVVGHGDPGPAVTIESTSRQILGWLVDRVAPQEPWPPLSPWQGIP